MLREPVVRRAYVVQALFIGGALGALAGGLIHSPDVAFVPLIVALLVLAWSLRFGSRADAALVRLGASRERLAVLASLEEAMQRRMSADEWLRAYLERTAAESQERRS
jgi:hypothetical protein